MRIRNLAARRLYESCGFGLVEEVMGNKWGKEMMIQLFKRSRRLGVATDS
jgi:RimJ/RimL family protein N-acetyltransferase